MARRRDLTGTLYRLARTSNNLRAASRGPTAYGKRMVRRQVYRRTGRTTRGLLRAFGLSR